MTSRQSLVFSNFDLSKRLKSRLTEINQEVSDLVVRQKRVMELLSLSNKIESGECLTKTERNFLMESLRKEVITGLRCRYSEVTDNALTYLSRDGWINRHPQIGLFFEGVKKCFDFAKERNFKLGTARGSVPASLSMFALGFSGIDPLKYEMIPERLENQLPIFHIDVEFERGQEFVDFCRDVNRDIPFGEIQAFKMPLIDVVQNVHKSIGKAIDYDSIEDDADIVLNPFRHADIEKIFQFDFSEDALVMNFERFLPDYLGLGKIQEYLRGQEIHSFRDVTNITALWRPHCREMVDRIRLYKEAKQEQFSYGFLSQNIESWLRPNFGTILYHEDILKIVSEYTGWDFARSNALRRVCMKKDRVEIRNHNSDWLEFNRVAPKQVVDLVAEESKWAFCLPHAISFAKFTKQTAVLKSLHKKCYFAEIERFEQKHGFAWDDIGIRIKGVSLHQG